MALHDGYSWLLRPNRHGRCLLESMKDGTIDLYDIALMNDDLDATDENARRAQAVWDTHRK